MKKMLSTGLVLTLMVGILSASAFASQIQEDEYVETGNVAAYWAALPEDVIPLEAADFETTYLDDGGVAVSFNLYELTNPVSDSIPATRRLSGECLFELILMPEYDTGYFSWTVNLLNGDVIKKVNIDFTCERNSIVNHEVYGTGKANVTYSTGTLYSTASGKESFIFLENDYDAHIKMTWKNILITGVDGKYSFFGGQKTGTVKDFVATK